jgi:integrase
MARAEKKLTARAAATKKPGRYGDGGGLWLVVSTSGARKWAFRFTWQGRVTEMGLGAADAVSLADAREAALLARKTLASGQNPIEARRDAKRSQTAVPSFGEIADALVESKASEWRNAKHREQWRIALREQAAALRSCPVDEIDTAAILEVLKPLWSAKPETASRLRGRIEAVLDAAKAKGYRAGENPARWRGHLSHLLPKRQKLTRGNHAAMPYADVPAFLTKLREQDNVGAWALEFTILTATRSGEVYGARWPEFDKSAKVWTLPPERTKAGRAHRVPLCDRASVLLERLEKAKTCEFVFPSPRGEKKLSHVAMAKAMRRAGAENATVHGFRSAFRDWAGNETHFPREVAEAALAHVVGDKAEQAYRRSDALEKRRALMEAWAAHCDGKEGANVVLLRRASGGEA